METPPGNHPAIPNQRPRRPPSLPHALPTPPASPRPASVAIPIPPVSVLSIPATIARLLTYLDPTHQDYYRVEQHPNIRKAISMYESGELDGLRQVAIMRGGVMKREEAWEESFRRGRGAGCCCWIEARGEFLRFVEET
ncbi:hypothetical protein VE01_06545, partial [Pseudogymnoascus verrucosus]